MESEVLRHVVGSKFIAIQLTRSKDRDAEVRADVDVAQVSTIVAAAICKESSERVSRNVTQANKDVTAHMQALMTQ